MKIEQKRVTPAMAERWLKKNHPQNRRMAEATVAAIADDIAGGRWKVTHQGICFSADGSLIDGQHRLSAIARSGIAVDLVVCENDDAALTDPIDTHRKRTASYLTGLTTKVIAACRVLRGMTEGFPPPHAVTPGDSQAIFEQFKPDFDALHGVPGRDKLYGGVLAGLVWAVPTNAKVIDFATQVARGEMLKRGDPAFALRNWLEQNRRALQPWDTALATLNCISHFLSAKEMRAVYSGESGYRYITAQRRVQKVPNTPAASLVPSANKP